MFLQIVIVCYAEALASNFPPFIETPDAYPCSHSSFVSTKNKKTKKKINPDIPLKTNTNCRSIL
jgi:hypothetical protein